jgi:hypothetical protein
MWCTSHPSDWKQHPVPTAETWTIEKIKEYRDHIDHREFLEA